MLKANRKTKQIIHPTIIISLLLILSGLAIFFSLVLPTFFSQSSFPMEIGDVATQDILAPYSLTFESEILTQRAIEEAEKAVEPIYLPADPSIGRQQVEKLRSALYYITTIRQDSFASLEEKISDIQSIENFTLSEENIRRILQLNDSRWESIQTETTEVLEQIMRNTMRESDIYTAKRNIPSLIDFSFPQDQANIVVSLVEPYTVPNSLYSEEQTQSAIEEARQTIEPVIRSFISGETLVRRGEIIRAEDWEALTRYGLIQASDQTKEMISAAVLTILVLILISLYFTIQKDRETFTLKAIGLITITFLVFLVIGRFIIIDRTVVPYILPIAAFGMTLAIVFNFEVAGFLSVVLGILTAYNMANGLNLTLFYILPAIIGMLALGKARRIASFFLAGISVGLLGVGVILVYRLSDSVTDWLGIATLSGASLINGIGAAGLTLLIQYIFSQILGLTTALQLLDTSRPDHPLLQKILRNAPGSYQHSLQVANLAEQAAEAIGADGLLVRVGAIYHDCGKSLNPQFFIENQVKENLNPHDDIDPIISAQTIINHVTEGVELAKKHHLPDRIIDFIREHHGTMHTHYQYSQALKEASNPEDVDKSLFTYPGPRPQSRETALLMLADGTEARARSLVPKNEEELQSLLDDVFNFYEKNKQLDDTNLTLKDLQKVKESFFYTLKGTYHPRIKYPSLQQTKPQQSPELSKTTQQTVK
jgi:putative nucleotidyltransferase with HDIG domain